MLKDSKISVLDVGSCYNPFKEFEELDVLPLDLCPALESVYQCDFLTVPVGEITILENQSVLSLASSSFHCVGITTVFCHITLFSFLNIMLHYCQCSPFCWNTFHPVVNDGLAVRKLSSS